MSDGRIVKLRNGIQALEEAVQRTYVAMLSLTGSGHPDDLSAAAGAVQRARNPGFPLTDDIAAILRHYGVLDDSGQMSDTTRDVILACTDDGDTGLPVTCPLADNAPEAAGDVVLAKLAGARRAAEEAEPVTDAGRAAWPFRQQRGGGQ